MNPGVCLSTIVLAGGQSRRMGRDKALIRIEGVPLLRRVCEAALPWSQGVTIVTAWPERYRSIVPSPCLLLQEQVNSGQPHGPLLGFAQALALVQTEWVLLLACDLPGLNAEALSAWVEQLENGQERDRAMAVLPKGDRGWEPLCGFYRASCLSNLKGAIARGDRSFQQWLAGELVRELQVSDRTLVFNCNTPEDLDWFTASIP